MYTKCSSLQHQCFLLFVFEKNYKNIFYLIFKGLSIKTIIQIVIFFCTQLYIILYFWIPVCLKIARVCSACSNLHFQNKKYAMLQNNVNIIFSLQYLPFLNRNFFSVDIRLRLWRVANLKQLENFIMFHVNRMK